MTNAETITRLADTALDLHTRARAQITPGGDTIGDGMPHAGGFGPKAPDNGAMMSLSDSLTVAAHTMLDWLWDAGIKPREQLPGLWTRWNTRTFGREVLGDNSRGEGMKHVHASLVRDAAWIAGAPGIELPLAEFERIVNLGLKVFPHEDTKWIDIADASSKYGRAERTIIDWVRGGLIEHVGEFPNVQVREDDVAKYIETVNRIRIENINAINGR